jgi:mRNA interferase MazF
LSRFRCKVTTASLARPSLCSRIFWPELESLVICPITSAVRDAAFRITVEPDNANGLRVLSQVMVDKLSTLPRSKISEPFGRLDDERMKAVDRALLLVVGLI